jgi:hypothetical protein
MIGNRNETGPDVLPGRLKVVTIGPCMTVAFAGDADPAGLAIQAARRTLLSGGVSAAIEALRSDSCSGNTDFIVASHGPEPSLVRLRNGVSLEIHDICTLGNDEPLRGLIDNARRSTDNKPLRKSDLLFRFIDLLLMGKHLHHGVGGFPMAVEAMPTGHRYIGCSGSYNYKFTEPRSGEENYQSIEDVYTGDGHFRFSVIPSKNSDMPVVGACLLQARMGYVYSPMEKAEPFSIPLAPADSLWAGKETQMYKVIKTALSDHVVAVTKMGDQ